MAAPGVRSAAIAITADGSKAYVAVERGQKSCTDRGCGGYLVALDLATGTPGKRIALPSSSPFGIAITPDGRRAYVTSEGSVVPITLANGTKGKPIRVGGVRTDIAIAPDGKTAYVTP